MAIFRSDGAEIGVEFCSKKDGGRGEVVWELRRYWYAHSGEKNARYVGVKEGEGSFFFTT